MKKTVSPTQQRKTWHLLRYAYHEAGHAVVGHLLGRCIAEVSVLLEKEGGYHGYCAFDAFIEDANDHPQWQKGSKNPELLTILYAGTIAMSIICEQRGWPYERWRGCDKGDFDTIYQWSLEMLETDEQRQFIQQECQKQARDLLNRSWFAVDELASLLLAEGFLSGGDVHEHLRNVLAETSLDWRLEAWQRHE